MVCDHFGKNPGVFTITFFLVCVLFASVLSAQAPFEKFQVYQSIPDEKSLLTSPQFVVIDDFNDGKFRNRRGAPWQTKTPAIGALDIGLDKTDARNAQRGYSLKATYNLTPDEQVSFRSFLIRLDVSRAEYFVFKYKLQVRGADKFLGRFRLALTDGAHRTVIQDITQLFPAQDNWEEVILPMSLFRNLDLDQLFSIEFILISKDKKIQGDLWVDEIAFFGFNDVAFESHRDNLAGFPKIVYDNRRRERLKREVDDSLFLKAVAYDTWKYFENARDKKTHLVVDHIRLGDAPLIADYTSPTNIAMDLLATVSAERLRFITREQALKRARDIFDTLRKLRRYKGFFYNFYDTKKLTVTRNYISTVDSGWLAIALVVIRQAYAAEMGSEVTALLDQFSFGEFLDPENNQFVVGIDVPERNFGGYHYGLLVTEARATSFYAIGKGDVPPSHWWFLYRTPPKVWRWQNQEPRGHMATYDGIDLFQGHYRYRDKVFVPSWGGSLFEFLMPTLVMKERELAPEALGLNNRIATQLHIEYALDEKGYPVWGISPAAISSGQRWTYGEFGIKEFGAKGYHDRGVVTPHVSFLALDSLPGKAIQNIRNFLEFPIYGEYGFFDTLNIRNNRVNPQYLALNQGMVLVAICNYLTQGAIQGYFHQDPIAKAAEELLAKEAFFST